MNNDEYEAIVATNAIYKQYKDTWQYHLESYLGGEMYKKAKHLTPYFEESDPEYEKRLNGTHLENHCNSVISVYNSFLFREEPLRELGQLKDLDETNAFLKDADLDGRSLNSFMKDVSTWSSVFGHAWVIVAKPNVNAGTRAEELAQGVRPYVSVLTPLTVLDWRYVRQPNGLYVLDYFKYTEEVNGDEHTIKIWTPELIRTVTVNVEEEEIVSGKDEIVDNQMATVPAVIAYANRSIRRDIGVSDINDIADAQKYIYNNNSEIEQSVRISSHPKLAATEDTDVSAGAGAGAVITMPDDLEPGLTPYTIEVNGADLKAILDVSANVVQAIDKMANTGAVRTSETTQLSGVAMQTEFQLLNARLSEKGDNLELAEEQMWRLFATYQDKAWDGEIIYPDSFNIQDTQNDIVQLKEAKEVTDNPDIIKVIDKQLVELLGEDPDEILITTESSETDSSV